MLALLSLFACTPEDGETAPVTPEAVVEALAAPGPHHVGYRWTETTYVDPLGDERTIHLAAWYPTASTTGEAAKYLLGSITDDNTLADAPPEAGSYPLIVFSHGHQAWPEVSSFLMEHLVSHGAVVIAPEHTDDTLFGDGSRSTAIYYQRPADVSTAIDAALASDLPIDAAAPILAMGHSFGGYTVHSLLGAKYDAATLDSCATPTADGFCSSMTDEGRAVFEAGLTDDRIAAGFSMAPGDFRLFEAVGLEAIERPILVAGGTLDPGGDASSFGEVLTEKAQNRYLRLTGAGHGSFTDVPEFQATEGEPLDGETGWRVLDIYATAWWMRLLGSTTVDEVLDGQVEVDAAVALSGG